MQKVIYSTLIIIKSIKVEIFAWLISGRLDVHWGSSGDGIPIWTRNGTTGYRWQQAQIPIYKPKIKTAVM